MRTCGKCGFLQPPDQYCAKCGVDMDSFAARRPPLLKRLAKSFTLRFLLIAAALYFGLDTYLKLRPTTSQDVQFVPIDDYPSTKPSKKAPIAEKLEDTLQDKLDNKLQIGNKVDTPTQELDQNSKPLASDVAVNGPISLTLRVEYSLLENESVENLINSSENQDSNGFSNSGSIKGFKESSLSSELQKKLLHKAASKPFSEGKDLLFDSAAKTGDGGFEEPLGLRVKVVATSERNGRAEFVAGLTGNFYDPESEEAPSPFEIRSFNPGFSLSPGDIGFVTGFLPHTPPRIAELDPFFAQGPLSVFKNPEFLERQADFVIFFFVEKQ